jgi:hypothetical protein
VIELYKNGSLSAANFSDIIRLNLLAKYGGIWIDSTIYLSAPLDEKIFDFPIYTVKFHSSDFFVNHGGWIGSFLRIKPSRGADIICGMIQKYWQKQSCSIDYFLIDYIIDLSIKINSDIAQNFQNIPYNNENVFKLEPLLIQKYDENLFTKITNTTNVHKLSWRSYTEEQLESNPDNLYHHLKEMVE